MSALKNVRVLTTAAMLVAIAIILGFFKIPITQLIEIRFGSLPIAAAGTLCGPIVAAIVGGLADVGGYLVKPTGPFFPGFTISGIISGLIFGVILYKKEITILRVLIAQILHAVIVSMLMNSFWLTVLYGNPFFTSVITRAPKSLIMIPINTALIFLVMKPVARLRPTLNLDRAAN